MKENIELLNSRVIDALDNTSTNKINDLLESIDSPLIITGVGGLKVVSDFASKVISKENRILSISKEPRSMLYEDTSFFKNVLCCSYSGNNLGVDASFKNDLNKYLLSNNESNRQDVVNVTYNTTMPTERSFISLAGTLIPMAILLRYYTKKGDFVKDLLKEYSYEIHSKDTDIYEIMSGSDTSVTSSFLESTLTESGIAVPIVHDKYSYCHGRSTLSKGRDSSLIFIDSGSELDKLLLQEIDGLYKEVFELKQTCGDEVINEFINVLKSVYISYALAKTKNKDLSKVDYQRVVKKLYKYNGSM